MLVALLFCGIKAAFMERSTLIDSAIELRVGFVYLTKYVARSNGYHIGRGKTVPQSLSPAVRLCPVATRRVRVPAHSFTQGAITFY